MILLVLGGCGGDDDASARDDGGGLVDASPDGPGPADGGADAGTDERCSASALEEPATSTTFFVAIDEPGADDDACDGRAASDEGGGRCPFRTLASTALTTILTTQSNVRVEVRSGTYVLDAPDGLHLNGTGASADEPVVLSAFPGEHPVIDVARPDGAGCTVPMTPGCVREAIVLSGSYTVVQGLTIQNGLAYHLEVRSGSNHRIRCNLFQETVAFDMRSDMIKLVPGATDIEIVDNEMRRFRSQAIDITGAVRVLVQGNELHDPVDADAGATGCKLGCADVTIRDNLVHDFGSAASAHVFAMGGTGATYPGDALAYRVHVEDNHVWNVAGILAQLESCQDCVVRGNDAWDIGGGVRFHMADDMVRASCGVDGGCLPTRNASIHDNRFRNLRGNAGAMRDTFVVVEQGEGEGLDMGENLYCSPAAEDARFGWEGSVVGFSEWTALAMTDTTSTPSAIADSACAF